MKLHRWQVVGMIAIAFVAGTWFWLSRPGPSRQSLAAKAAFTRPVEITPGLQQYMRVELSGHNWWEIEPVVTLGEEISLSAKWIGKKDWRFRHLLDIAPRPEADPDFSFTDQRVDWYTSATGKTKKYVIRLQPGRYIVRFFMETLDSDEDRERPPRVNLIAERPLIVRPSSDPNVTGVLPGDDPRKRYKMIVSEQGPGLD